MLRAAAILVMELDLQAELLARHGSFTNGAVGAGTMPTPHALGRTTRKPASRDGSAGHASQGVITGRERITRALVRSIVATHANTPRGANRSDDNGALVDLGPTLLCDPLLGAPATR